jgi:hypothetical protein
LFPLDAAQDVDEHRLAELPHLDDSFACRSEPQHAGWRRRGARIGAAPALGKSVPARTIENFRRGSQEGGRLRFTAAGKLNVCCRKELW